MGLLFLKEQIAVINDGQPYKHYEMINKTKNNLNLRLTEVIKKRLGENVVFILKLFPVNVLCPLEGSTYRCVILFNTTKKRIQTSRK